jgi:hypothetical protein
VQDYPTITISYIGGKFFVNTILDRKNFDFRCGTESPAELQANIDEAIEQVKAGRIGVVPFSTSRF